MPAPVNFSYPVLLQGSDFELLAYSWESVIAEKLESIVKFGFINSRMKDFYDIYFLSLNQSFSAQTLSSAIKHTFENRKTPFNYALIFTDSFINDDDKNNQWNAFLNRLQLSSIEFKTVMVKISAFLDPVIKSSNEKIDLNLVWDQHCQKWSNQI